MAWPDADANYSSACFRLHSWSEDRLRGLAGSVPISPSVVSEATAKEKLVASSESAAVALDTTT
jgi:hypothetical protein